MEFNIDHRFAGLLDIPRLIYQNEPTSGLSDIQLDYGYLCEFVSLSMPPKLHLLIILAFIVNMYEI